MAIGDYILCCKCEVKLIYDGDRDQREWWEERFGKEPEIECPNCKPQRKPLTHEEMKKIWYAMQNIMGWYSFQEIAQAIEAAHGIKETK
jgi:hypothetical protein